MQLPEVYSFDPEQGFWRRAQEHAFAYSDGDAIEQKIGRIVRGCSDPSILSDELERAIDDWPSLYHLGKGRINLLRPFLPMLGGRVLEIGCGCGAITRALGEQGGQIVALEGSAVRAGIAASRSRDLNNVQVVCDSFDRFETDEQFDVVTLIGVLEYARKYFAVASGEDPIRATIERAKSFLRPGGILLVAIENQLGLKYLAGTPEDHNGVPMYGVEDLYGAQDAVTFGEQELRGLLGQAGLGAQHWWYPFPDYKFPVSIFSESGVRQTEADLSPLLQNSALLDPQRAPTSFSLESAWLPVYRNGLAGALANSFLVLASDQPRADADEDVLAYHYASNRREGFAKQVTFVKRADGAVKVRHTPLFGPQEKQSDAGLAITFEEAEFISGRHWQKELVHIVNRPGWSLADLQAWAQVWFAAFLQHTGVDSNAALDKDMPVAGDHFDAVPRNLIVQPDGAAVFFDQEWQMPGVVPLGLVIFRSLGLSFFGVTSVAKPRDGEALDVKDLLLALAASVGVALVEDDLPSYIEQENHIQALVAPGSRSQLTMAALADWTLNVRTALWDPARLYRLEAEIRQRDEQLGGLGEEVHRLEAYVRDKDQSLHELGASLHQVHTVLADKDAALEQQAQEIHRLEEIVQSKDALLQQVGTDLSASHNNLSSKDDALSAQAAEILRLESVLAERDALLEQAGAQRSELHAMVESKVDALHELAAEIHRLEAVVLQKDASLREVGAQQSDLHELTASKLDALHQQATEIQRLESMVLQKDLLLQKTGQEQSQLHGAITGKLDALDEQAAEIRRLQDVVVQKDASLQQCGQELSYLHSTVADKLEALGQQAAEIHRLEEMVVQKDASLQRCGEDLSNLHGVLAAKLKALDQQADDICRLEQFAHNKQEVVQLLSGQLAALSESIPDQTPLNKKIEDLILQIQEEAKNNEALQAQLQVRSNEMTEAARQWAQEREYFYAEVAKRDTLLAGETSALAQAKSELAAVSQQLQALKLTRWFRLREVVLFHPFGIKKAVHVACILAGAALPQRLRSTLVPRVNRLFGLTPSSSSEAGAASGAYRIKQTRRPPADAPKVVHVIANFMTGGSSRLVVDLIEYLGGDYHQQVLTSFNPDPPAYVGLDIHECRSADSVEPFLEYFTRVKPDLVHVHYWGDCDEPWYAKAIEAVARLGVPVVENINTPIEPYRSEAVVKYVYVSDYVRSVFGDPDARHVTVYPGSDFQMFTRGADEHPPADCVGMVYRLERDKLNEDAIQPFIHIAKLRPQTRILIVGGGSLLEPFQQAVEAAGVADQFEFTGYVSYSALPGLYRRMSLFVAPVWKESFGQVSPFAMSMKVPVIGYDVGAIGEIVDNRDLLAPPADAERLAQIAVRLLDAPDEARHLGDQQQKRAQEHFSIQAMIDGYARIYADVSESMRRDHA
jgi:glycosyltransferase involved in cell wall biosynthesis/SAM-dependent methyltransferase